MLSSVLRAALDGVQHASAHEGSVYVAESIVSLVRALYLGDADGMGVGEWIRTRRLARIRRDLHDPSLAHETVSRIAARWGIHNAAYLARAFRSQYGQSPRECREDAGPAPGVDPAPPEVDR